MSDKLMPISMKSLAKWVSTELEIKNSIFGIPKKLFFTPLEKNIYETELYGQKLESPFGVAAGPHTQMSQNLIVSWLCGCRFLELKTVQILDELKLSKPCIDMQDEGYNVEWSQELKLEQSLDEYLKAWVIIHALHKKLRLPGENPGVIFNTSIGYNYEGILKDNMQKFIRGILNSENKKNEYVDITSKYFPEIKEEDVPGQISNNIALSTMHGCPPDEIGKIAKYLINEFKFHTNVKLNPTAVGSKTLRYILNEKLGYSNITVPDFAFGHDIKYDDAIKIIKELKEQAKKNDVVFGIKLSNTLEVLNHRNVFNENEKQMYMSGRPLHALTVTLAKEIVNDLNGDILISFAGGADCFNVSNLLKSGMSTITACSDILRPGGYMRFSQWFNETKNLMDEVSAKNLKELIIKSAEHEDESIKSCSTESNEYLNKCKMINLNKYANDVLENDLLYKDRFNRKRTKTERGLKYFDCIKAPCTDECPIDQKAYKYISEVENNNLEQANKTILTDNVMPNILGRACDHECESVCTRTHYDDPIAIREVKRYISDKKFDILLKDCNCCLDNREEKVAIIGSGPCGITAASYLAFKGYPVTIFESRNKVAGMVDITIPKYRIQEDIIKKDVGKLEDLNIKFELDKKIDKDFNIDSLKNEGFKYIIIATGAQTGSMINIPGENSEGVIDGITFLKASKSDTPIKLGSHVGIIGGGDVAMDCARVANRMSGGKVFVIYRKTKNEMPAHKEELEGLINENIEVKELLSPKRIKSVNGKIDSLICTKMTFSEPDEYGKKKIIETTNREEIEIPLDNLIIAVGQQADLDFFGNQNIKLNNKGFIDADPKTLETSIDNIYCGGDVSYHGPSTIVRACSDGKKISKSIYCKSQQPGTCKICDEIDELKNCNNLNKDLFVELMRKRSNRRFRGEIQEIPVNDRMNFDEIIKTLSDPKAKEEVKRCLKCDLLCNTCVTVCPNKALFSYEIEPKKFKLPILKIKDNALIIDDKKEEFEIKQKYQVAVYNPFCNDCGNCETFCPTSGKPSVDKPRFYNDIKEFEEELDNANIIFRHNDYEYSMKSKFEGKDHKITIKSIPPNNHIICECDCLKFNLNTNDFSIIDNKIECKKNAINCKSCSLKHFAKMYCLLISIVNNMPELPENRS